MVMPIEDEIQLTIFRGEQADECTASIAKQICALPRMKLALALLDVRLAELALEAEERQRERLHVVSG